MPLLGQFSNSSGATVYIIGSGSVGTFLSAALSGKNKVRVVTRSNSKPRNINIAEESQKGIGSAAGNHVLPLIDWASIRRFEKDSIIFIAVKAGDVREVSRLLESRLDGTQTLVFLQNGLNIIDDAKELSSYKRVVRSMVLFGVNVTSAGLKVSAAPKVTLASKTDPFALNNVAKLFEDSGIGVAHKTDNVAYIEWKKSLLNVYISGLTAICDKTIGEVLENKASAFFAKKLLMEAAKMANMEGAFFTPEEINNIDAMAQRVKGHSTSMREDIRNGRKTEAMWLYGHMVKVAKRTGNRVPATELVFSLIEKLEQNERSPAIREAIKEICGEHSDESALLLDPALRKLIDDVYEVRAPKRDLTLVSSTSEAMVKQLENIIRNSESKGVKSKERSAIR